AGLTRTLKYRMTEWSPGPVSAALSAAALKRQLAGCGLTRASLRIVDHHEAHAAGAAWASGFTDCAVLTIDGLGDGLSSTISAFRGGRLERGADRRRRQPTAAVDRHPRRRRAHRVARTRLPSPARAGPLAVRQRAVRVSRSAHGRTRGDGAGA